MEARLKARYWFWYGATLGVLAATAISNLVDESTTGWMLASAALALALALLIHQRAAAQERGRRWRKTRD